MSNETQIPLSLQDQHAAVAASGDPLEVLIAAEEQEQQVEEEVVAENTGANISLVTAVLMVTASLGSRKFLAGKRDLKSVDSPYGLVNLYSPLQRQNTDKDPSSVDGAARMALFKAAELVDDLNGQNLHLLGDELQIVANLQGIVGKIVREIELELPFEDDTQIKGIVVDEDSDEPITASLYMRDMVRIRGWVHHDENGADEVFGQYNIVINVIVDGGVFYDHKDPHKYVLMIQSVLKRIQKQAKNGLTVLSGVLLPSKELMQKPIYEMFGILTSESEEYEYDMLTRDELILNGGDTNWAPHTKAQVINDLLPLGGDNLLIKVI